MYFPEKYYTNDLSFKNADYLFVVFLNRQDTVNNIHHFPNIFAGSIDSKDDGEGKKLCDIWYLISSAHYDN